jgi:hypothetical protein
MRLAPAREAWREELKRERVVAVQSASPIKPQRARSAAASSARPRAASASAVTRALSLSRGGLLPRPSHVSQARFVQEGESLGGACCVEQEKRILTGIPFGERMIAAGCVFAIVIARRKSSSALLA